jgi:hypothetical protein
VIVIVNLVRFDTSASAHLTNLHGAWFSLPSQG